MQLIKKQTRLESLLWSFSLTSYFFLSVTLIVCRLYEELLARKFLTSALPTGRRDQAILHLQLFCDASIFTVRRVDVFLRFGFHIRFRVSYHGIVQASDHTDIHPNEIQPGEYIVAPKT